MKDDILTAQPEPAANSELVWAFDLGQGYLGDIPTLRGGVGKRYVVPKWSSGSSRHTPNRTAPFLFQQLRLIPTEFEKDKTSERELAGFVLETLFNAACPHGEQWHGLR